MRRPYILTLILSVMAVISSGTVFFRYAEGWSWLDAHFFTLVMVSTVGYGNLVPATNISTITTTPLIFIGLAISAVAIQHFGVIAMRKRKEHTEWLIGRLGHQDEGDLANTANGPKE